jgi:predicted nucleic acid-binding protein
VNLVLDASMTIAWLFPDERTQLTQTTLRQVAVEGAMVPTIWRLEVANVMRNAVRRGRCDDQYAERSLRRLNRLRIIVDGETDSQAWGATRELSRAHDLILYDAAYLELAVRRRQVLVSQDTALLKAARTIGLDVIGG